MSASIRWVIYPLPTLQPTCHARPDQPATLYKHEHTGNSSTFSFSCTAGTVRLCALLNFFKNNYDFLKEFS